MLLQHSTEDDLLDTLGFLEDLDAIERSWQYVKKQPRLILFVLPSTQDSVTRDA